MNSLKVGAAAVDHPLDLVLVLGPSRVMQMWKV